MKNKIFIISFLAVVLALAGNTSAMAQNGAGVTDSQNEQMKATAEGQDIQIQMQNNEQAQGGDTTTQQRGNEQQPPKNENATGTKNEGQEQNKEGEINAEQHRSAVANFVQKLLDVANREGGIGEQVKTIAQEQKQAVDTTVQAIEKVQKRSNIATFLLGSDYKNLGTLRSEMVQTDNRLEKLNELLKNATAEADKTELQNQIKTLETEQTKITNFIKSQEGKFSLFGWLVKMFNQ